MINTKILFPSLALLFFGSMISRTLLIDGRTIVLYDAASGNLPNPSLIGFTALPQDAVSISYADGATTMDTTLSGLDAYAGWVSNPALAAGFPILDRTAGVQVNFTLQLESEAHAHHDRAGFSVIILDKDAKGIELSFWQNEIWVQNDDATGGLFTHGEGVTFGTTSGLTEYQVIFEGDRYTLTANAVPILTGMIRDYSSFEGFIDPYETPNFLFLGDDTTSAQSRVRLIYLSVTGTELVLPTLVVMPTNTSFPQPAASSTAPPTITTIPSSTQNPTGIDICPSGWLLAVVIFGNIFNQRMIQHKSTDIS